MIKSRQRNSQRDWTRYVESDVDGSTGRKCICFLNRGAQGASPVGRRANAVTRRDIISVSVVSYHECSGTTCRRRRHGWGRGRRRTIWGDLCPPRAPSAGVRRLLAILNHARTGVFLNGPKIQIITRVNDAMTVVTPPIAKAAEVL